MTTVTLPVRGDSARRVRARALLPLAAIAIACSGGGDPAPTPAVCGNGVVEAGEACDDGAANSATTPDACRPGCVAARCGDGIVDSGEACDDGNAIDGDACTSLCTAATCGDGIVWAGVEQCDDGNASNADGCLDTCVSATCGDGFTWTGVEACDDGNAVDADGCTTLCEAPSCGDGVTWAGVEQCDDGNASNADACLTTCVAARCGDGFVQGGVEACDDGNASNADACLTTCVAATCGDGFVWAGVEQCDDGAANSDTAPDACRTTCVAAACGDGVVDAGEGCDNGGATATCDADCTPAACGDGTLNLAAGETCDDGNLVDGDGCSPLCKRESGILRVDARAPAGGDGSSWAKAIASLQDALAISLAGDEIWVAAGTYRPDHGAGKAPGDRTASFALKTGVALYGGFGGTETARSERDWNANVTILSGDIGVTGTATDNSYHVVWATSVDATGVLDGFVVRDGYANGSGYYGGGLAAQLGGPTIENCTFTANVARSADWALPARGGAIYGSESSMTIRSCTFTDNVAENTGSRTSFSFDALGGAMYLDPRSFVRVSDSTFARNSAKTAGGKAMGGAIYFREGTNDTRYGVFLRCTFVENAATAAGSNTAYEANGGAVALEDWSDVALVNVQFLRNTATGAWAQGGGLYAYYYSPAKVVNGLFDSNRATSSLGNGFGGGVATIANDMQIRNCTFVDNVTNTGKVNDAGAAVYAAALSYPYLYNAVVYGNVAYAGRQVYADTVSGVHLTTVSLCQTGTSPFLPDSRRLAPGSACADFGTASGVGPDLLDLDGDGDVAERVPFDLDGNPRFADDPLATDRSTPPPVVDAGAYETQPAP